MQLKGINVTNASKLIQQHVDSVTCLECCKYFIAPERATCGHTLCHSCWKGRRACPACAISLDRRALKRDEPMIILTDHIRELVMAYEKMFDIKMDEFVVDIPIAKKDDPNKNVKDWLTSSDNHFSAPPYSGSQQSTQDILPPITLSTSKVQIHAEGNKSLSPKKATHVVQPQDDWDKIEVLPDTEVTEANKNKQNIVGPMDLEPFYFDENDYSNEHPRRSSRKKDITLNSKAKSDKPDNNDKLGSHDSSAEAEKKLDKVKQNWTNVKKMKKEFSKLNKLNKNKLNVSIEMCKKTQSVVSKQSSNTPPNVNVEEIVIDDNTPNIIEQVNNKIINKVILTKEIIEEVPETDEVEAVSSERILRKNTQKQNLVKKDDFIDKNNSKDLNADYIMDVDEVSNTNNAINNSNKVKSRLNYHNEQIIPVMQEKNINIAMSQCAESIIKIPFFKKSPFQVPCRPEKNTTTNQIQNNVSSVNPDDIHITIRIGDVVTNITINKKQNDVELKVNTDREIQTSLDPQPVKDDKTLPQEVKTTRDQNIQTDTQIIAKPVTQISTTPQKAAQILDKTVSTKKNTASAETATAQFEITESVEKELSNIMECDEETDETHNSDANANNESSKNTIVVKGNTQVLNSKTQVLKCNSQVLKSNSQVSAKTTLKNGKPQTEEVNIPEDIEFDDMDIFNSGSVKETNVHVLGKSKYTPSEILPTYKTNKSKTQKLPEKRDRDPNEIEEQPNKRQKVDTPHNSQQEVAVLEQNKTTDSPNYDELMGEVFANIDADIIEIKSQNLLKTQKKVNSESQVSQTILHKSNNKTGSNINTQPKTLVDVNTQDLDSIAAQKESENMFSTVGNALERVNTHVPGPDTQLNIANLLTPRMCEDLASTEGLPPVVPGTQSVEVVVHCTPAEDYDSDKSVVEETPQKNISNQTSKGRPDSNGNKSANTSKKLGLAKPAIKVNEEKAVAAITQGKSLDSQDIGSIINLTDSVMDTTNRQSKETSVAPIRSKQTSETPLTINRFVDQIKHNSTPMARKSLNFTKNENEADEDITLCPTNNSNIAKNTQEKQFMSEAFENMPNSPVRRPLVARNVVEEKSKKFVIAGSCLTATEQTNLKILCFKRKWTFVDKYTRDLTHLVVSVDEEFKAQRSVKYMCALAAGKWIIAYKWVEKCLESNTLFEEEPFEALDSTGDPGPRRSRLATRKVFEGITFYCMPPFSVLDIDTLKSMLLAAGGRVAAQPSEARAAGPQPALLLAEPEHTQEDRFMYLAMELSIVPVNYEWALNCLGSYALCSLLELLLCPAALLRPACAAWPRALVDEENEE